MACLLHLDYRNIACVCTVQFMYARTLMNQQSTRSRHLMFFSTFVLFELLYFGCKNASLFVRLEFNPWVFRRKSPIAAELSTFYREAMEFCCSLFLAPWVSYVQRGKGKSTYLRLSESRYCLSIGKHVRAPRCPSQAV